jgi:hypothetical protein
LGIRSRNFFGIYRQIADTYHVYDAAFLPLNLIAMKIGGKLELRDAELFDSLVTQYTTAT